MARSVRGSGRGPVLIARAPLRLSLAGGGTDLEAYYAKYGGAVVSTSIDKYFYVILTFNDSNHIQVSSSDYRTFYRHSFEGPPIWDLVERYIARKKVIRVAPASVISRVGR